VTRWTASKGKTFLVCGVVFPDDGSGCHRNKSEYSLALSV